MVTGFEDGTTWGYDAALGYDEEQRREARQRYEERRRYEERQRYEEQQRYAATDVRPASFGAPPPGAPSPAPSPGAGAGASGTGAMDTASAGQVWRAATTAEPGPAQMMDELTAQMTVAGVGDAGTRPHPARLVLGMATLAAERLRGGAPAGDALATGVGLVQESAASARDLARRVLEPAARMANDAVDRAALIPGADRPLRTLSRSRARFTQVVDRARRRGEATVAAGRAEAEAFVRTSVAETLSWAQAQAVPQIVDGIVPHLVDQVVPRILEGTLPEIRARVLPAVIDDLAASPKVRELVLEQGRGVAGEAALNLRTTAATADDQVESAFRRLIRAPAPEGPTDQPPPPPHGQPQNGGNGS
jgi:hypothetical protein